MVIIFKFYRDTGTGTRRISYFTLIWKIPQYMYNYFRPVDSVKAGGYFFYAGKTLIGAFQGIFHGDKKSRDLHENHKKGPNMCFSQVK